jgi:quercetin dioxygenase-like cupin family protein
MKTSRWMFVLAALLAAASAPAQSSGDKAKPARKSSAETPIFIPAANVKWTDLDPSGAPRIRIADLWGDHARGAYGAFLEFPAGFLSPLHTHTHAIKIVVVSGTYTQTPEGKAEQRLGPGSYAFQPGGNYKHVSGCDKASDCVLFIESSGAFDLKPVEAAAAK